MNLTKLYGTESINLLKKDNNIYQKQETNNNIIKKGLIEKSFGGVGPNCLTPLEYLFKVQLKLIVIKLQYLLF